MLVRFDGKKVQETQANTSDPIGVEGDPATSKGTFSEAEQIVLDAKKKLEDGGATTLTSGTGEPLEKVPTDVVKQVEEDAKVHEAGPELNLDAAVAARKDGGGVSQ